jgi:hypothetical protein
MGSLALALTQRMGLGLIRVTGIFPHSVRLLRAER